MDIQIKQSDLKVSNFKVFSSAHQSLNIAIFKKQACLKEKKISIIAGETKKIYPTIEDKP